MTLLGLRGSTSKNQSLPIFSLQTKGEFISSRGCRKSYFIVLGRVTFFFVLRLGAQILIDFAKLSPWRIFFQILKILSSLQRL